MSTSLLGLIMLLVPVVVGYLTKYIVNLLKTISAFADSNAFIKQMVGLIVSGLLSLITATFHVALVGNSIGSLTASDVGTILTALIGWALAMLFHNATQLPASTLNPK